MKKRHIVAFVVAILFLAIMGSVYKLFNSETYLFSISELKIKKSNSSDIVNVYGFVKEGSIHFDRNRMVLTFDVYDKSNPENIIYVFYKGPKPDLLKTDQKGIFIGKYNQYENIFNASNLIMVFSEHEEKIWRMPALTKH